jgi:hypothetical protein
MSTGTTILYIILAIIGFIILLPFLFFSSTVSIADGFSQGIANISDQNYYLGSIVDSFQIS